MEQILYRLYAFIRLFGCPILNKSISITRQYWMIHGFIWKWHKMAWLWLWHSFFFVRSSAVQLYLNPTEWDAESSKKKKFKFAICICSSFTSRFSHWKCNWFDDIEWITCHRQLMLKNHLTVRQATTQMANHTEKMKRREREKNNESVIDGINILTFTYALWVISYVFDDWRDEADI